MVRRHLSTLVLFAALFGATLLFAKERYLTRDLVYPPTVSALHFDHARHGKLACEVCHKEIQASTKATDRNLPSEALCSTCHKDQTRQSPSDLGDARCLFCHADWDEAHKQVPSSVKQGESGIQFSHSVHLRKMLDCSVCHQNMDKDPPERDHLPSEELCLSCHREWKTQSRCTRCHLALPSGKMKTSFRAKALQPERGRLDHTRHWLTRHAKESTFRPADCMVCHQQHQCDDCHNGVARPLTVHPNNYVVLHPQEARQNPRRCQACHRMQSFCKDCHDKHAVGPSAGFRSPRVKIHPDGFGACMPSANHHAGQARRGLLACVSCHTEEQCARCHKSGGECGFNIPIHRSMNPKQLARMQKRNGRACKKCHANL